MLQYRDSYDYGLPKPYSIDDELEQLRQLLMAGGDDFQLYQQIRKYCFRQIKITELAATIILKDLELIKAKSEKAANIITFFICNSDSSYKEIGEFFGVTKQSVYDLLTRWSKEYKWLANLIIIKGNELAKNENNRTIFFSAGASRNHFLIEQEGEDENR